MWCTKPSISFCLKQKQFFKKVLIYPCFHESDANKAGLRLNTLRNVAVKGSVMSAHGLSPCRTVYIYQNWRDVFSFMQYMPPLIHKERLSLSAYYSRLDWHSEREKKKKKKKEEGDTGGNKREKVKSMARTRRERAFTPSADQLGEGRKWDEEAQVLRREKTGGGWMCVYGRRGGSFSYSCSVGSAHQKRQQNHGCWSEAEPTWEGRMTEQKQGACQKRGSRNRRGQREGTQGQERRRGSASENDEALWEEEVGGGSLKVMIFNLSRVQEVFKTHSYEHRNNTNKRRPLGKKTSLLL